MESSRKWVEKTLREKYENIGKIDSISFTRAADCGSFSCTVEKVEVKIISKCNIGMNRSFIFKKYRRLENCKERIEVKMYKNVLPQMESLMMEFHKTKNTTWPNYISADESYDNIILEDLTETGYKTVDIIKGFDKVHALLIIEETARFHAMSLILLEKNLIDLNEYSSHRVSGDNDSDKIAKFYCQHFTILEDVIRTNWGSTWNWASDMLNKWSKNCSATLNQILLEDYPLKVLVHGDLWSPNTMFHYNNGNSYPDAVKIIDFENCQLNSFACDLTSMFYNSIRLPLRQENYDLFLSTYYESLINSLQSFGNNTSIVPNLEVLHKEMERHLFHAFAIAMADMVYIFAGPEQIYLSEDFETKMRNIYMSEDCKNLLQNELIFFKNKNIFRTQ